MFKVTMKNGKKVYLRDVSEMAREKKRLDYASLIDWCTEGHMVGLSVSPWKMAEDWEKQTERDFDCFADADEEEQDEDEADEEVFQWFIISDEAAYMFSQLTNELIYYSSFLDMYILGVTHLGTAWSYVMTEWKLEEE